MSRGLLVWPDGNEDARHPEGLNCHCGEFLPWCGFGSDYSCDKCGREYNSGGQELAPRSQWGEETGEHPADIARAFGAHPEHLARDSAGEETPTDTDGSGQEFSHPSNPDPDELTFDGEPRF